MGARTNFVFQQSGEMYITLYSHWGGDSKLPDLAYAINAARPRWSDEGYATRIMVSSLIGSDWDSETGFGLYAGSQGGEESYEETTIDLELQLVRVNGFAHTYDEFINIYAKHLLDKKEDAVV